MSSRSFFAFFAGSVNLLLGIEGLLDRESCGELSACRASVSMR